MGTTANYSWPTPVATDLVKDGWEAIKDLGDAADTTVKAVSDAQGLVYIDTVSFSASSAESLDNVFTSTYRNYRVICETVSSTGSEARLRFRASGSDDTNANYQLQRTSAFSTTTSSARVSNATSYRIEDFSTTRCLFILDISNPQTAIATGILHNFVNAFNSTGPFTQFGGGGFSNTTSFDGFTIYPSSGTITGTISVYAYKD